MNHVAAVIVVDIPEDNKVSNSWNNGVEKETAKNCYQEVSFPFLGNIYDRHCQVYRDDNANLYSLLCFQIPLSGVWQ